MPATVALFLLVALPIGHSPDSAMQSAADPPRGCPAGQNLPRPASGRPDACLCDVAFVDSRHGWAVGDHGTILHTDDGGQHWSPQASGVVCTLNSVCFIDARIGWAAGGMAWPFLHDTSGVVLATRDGGRTWRRELVLLPTLYKIRFVSDRQGWAIGCSSAMYPGGVFVTRDGGRSWQPAADGGAIGLTAGDLYDGRNAILGGPLGRLATINAGDFGGKARPSKVLPGVHAMQTVPPSYGWLAGDGGWIALTGDRGDSWRPPLGKPPACAVLFDFTARSRPRRQVLDLRFAWQPHFQHAGRRTYLVRRADGHYGPPSRNRIRRRRARLGRRAAWHDPRHQRRRPDVAAATRRRRPRRTDGRGGQSERLATGIDRPHVQGPRILRRGRSHWP